MLSIFGSPRMKQVSGVKGSLAASADIIQTQQRTAMRKTGVVYEFSNSIFDRREQYALTLIVSILHHGLN